MTRWVYGLDDLAAAKAAVGGDWDRVRKLLGGKGANLADMASLGIPVPPGFTITTEACNAFIAGDGTLPDGLWDEVLAAMRAVEARTGKSYGGTDNPLLVAVRSGAKFSMPGMMDTVLNVGMNDEVAAAMIAFGIGATGDATTGWVITIPSVSVLAGSVWEFAKQMVVQQVVYDGVVQKAGKPA